MAIADLALVNAKVVTVDASSQIAEAVAVRAGRIVAVGTNAEVRAMRLSLVRTSRRESRALSSAAAASRAIEPTRR